MTLCTVRIPPFPSKALPLVYFALSSSPAPTLLQSRQCRALFPCQRLPRPLSPRHGPACAFSSCTAKDQGLNTNHFLRALLYQPGDIWPVLRSSEILSCISAGRVATQLPAEELPLSLPPTVTPLLLGSAGKGADHRKSQDPRLVLVGRVLEDHFIPPLPPEQVTQSPIQPDLKHLPKCRRMLEKTLTP